MEQEFRTTFIPKKPIAQPTVSSSAPVGKPVGILFVIAVVIFIISIVCAAGAYFYKSYQTKETAVLADSLVKVQKNLETNVVKEFTIMDKRLKNAETLVNQHTVVAPLFLALQKSTLPAVRYTKLDVSYDENKNLVTKLSGESDGYRSIALQSQALAQNTSFKNILFSNFVVTPKGRVSFDVTFSLPIADLAFDKFIGTYQPATTINLINDNQIPMDVISDQSDDTVTQEVTADDTVDPVPAAVVAPVTSKTKTKSTTTP